MILFVTLDLGRFISFESLREHREVLNNWVSAYPLFAPLAYILLYIVVVAFSLPGGAVMTVSGGFLFGTWFGTAYAMFGATIGATALFLVARTSMGDFLKAKAGPWLSKMQDGFNENALSYLLVLRLMPLFPFWLVNLAPAFLGVSLRVYLIATLVGIMPATFVYALAGSGLGSVFDQGGELSIKSVLTPEIMAALGGLALLSMIPVVYKRLRKSRSATEGGSL
ncbi:MAG: TVP38/TMEM64 family protein [Mariprofundaceae bacterium]|nr:TVP38/TMEM64 family protein [Mariprofundaceae bacterium]